MKKYIYLFLFLTIYVFPTEAKIDTSFANKGYAEFNLGYASARITDIEKDANGKIVTVSVSDWYPNNYGEIIVSRFHENGIEDSTFGIDGHQRIIGINIDNQTPFIKVDQQNRYLIASGTILCRMLQDGSLDKEFAENGILKLNTPQHEDYGLSTKIKDIFVHPDQSISLIYFNSYSSFWPPVDIASNGVLKILNTGQIDTSFGENGYIHQALKYMEMYQGDHHFADPGAMFDQDGNAYLFKNTFVDSISTRNIIKINRQGQPDSTWGQNGLLPLSLDLFEKLPYEIEELKVHDNGSLFLKNYERLVKLNHNGDIDSTWGQNGMIDLADSEPLNFSFIGDELLVYGHQEIDNSYKYFSYIKKYNSLGQLIENSNAENFKMYDLVFNTAYVQNDGNILIGGYHSSNGNYTSRITLNQYNSNLEIDSTFGQNGTGKYYPKGNSTGINNTIVFDDGSMIVSGHAYNGVYYDRFIAKHNYNSQYDTLFGDKGLIYQPFHEKNNWYKIIQKLDEQSFLCIFEDSNNEKHQKIYKLSAIDGRIDQNWANGNIFLELDSQKTYHDLRINEQGLLNITYFDPIQNRIAIDQYLPSGIINTSFGQQGTLVLNKTVTSNTSLVNIHFSQQNIFIHFKDGNERFIEKFNYQGNKYNIFGNNGQIKLGYNFFRFYIHPDQSIFVLQNLENEKNISILKFDASGHQDMSYGINGRYANIDYPAYSENSFANRLILKDDKSVILVYESFSNGLNKNINFMEIDANGIPNPNFGDNGVIRVWVSKYDLAHYNIFQNPVDLQWMISGTKNNQSNTSYFMTKLLDMRLYTNTKDHAFGKQNTLHVYPNPGQNEVFIDFKNHKINKLLLINSFGQIIKEWNRANLNNTSHLIQLRLPTEIPNGQYIFIGRDEKNTYSTHWIKMK